MIRQVAALVTVLVLAACGSEPGVVGCAPLPDRAGEAADTAAFLWTGDEDLAARFSLERDDLRRARFTVHNVPSDEGLLLHLSGGARIDAAQVTATDGMAFRTGAEAEVINWLVAEPTDAVDSVCVVPRPGNWLVQADVNVAGDAGSGIYHWRLIVRE